MQISWKKTLLAAATLVALQSITAVQAQPPAAEDQPRTESPRLADGTIDFGGNGVWSLPWVTDFAVRMPGAKEGEQPPMLAWTKAMFDYNKGNSVKYDPEGFCLPPGGPRSMGTPYPVEIIQDRDRIVLIFEGGGHVWREIHMDGRPHPEGDELNRTYFGHSTGKWEGDTLVVDTVGFNEKTWLDFGGYMHTDQLHTVERFSRPFKEVLHYESVIDDPGAYSKPWTVGWDIDWSDGQELADYVCQENNKFLLDMHDDLGLPFFEKSAGL